MHADLDPRNFPLHQDVDIVVIGAGQAGLASAFQLRKRGMAPWEDFVVLDQKSGPGGAWRDRWESLTFGKAHRIHPLPEGPLDPPDPSIPAREVVAAYFGEYENTHELPVLRPVRVNAVKRDQQTCRFMLRTSAGKFSARAVINASGTWESPYVPHYPGIDEFVGLQRHTRTYRSAAEFAGRRTLVVGGGTSALQFLQELSLAGVETVWSTRRAPQWTARNFDQEWGLDVENAVSSRTQAGLPPLAVSAVTGLPLNEHYLGDIRSGLLLSRGPLVRFERENVVLNGPGPDGSGIGPQGAAQALHTTTARTLPGEGVAASQSLWRTPIEAVLWATGFRAHLPHLQPLGLRGSGGGIRIAPDGVSVLRQPGFFVAGYGASASTLGATRAGRRAALAALASLGFSQC